MPDIILTALQEKAVANASKMSEVFTGKPMIGVLRGAAGCGKTTAVKAVINEIGPSIIVAPTGKAAQRVRELTGYPGQTIHRWLYRAAVDERTGEVSFERRAIEDIETSESGILIVDEGSMIPQDLWEDVYSACLELGLNILVVGDHAQLPPVSRENDRVFNLVSPDFNSDWSVTLDVVHRQALDSPIIAAATEIRCGDVMDGLLSLPRIMVPGLVQACLRTLDAGGVILCHRNSTRHRLNAELRYARYGSDTHEIHTGEPLLVLKNQYALNRFNGEILEFRGWEEKINAEMPIWDPKTRKQKTTGFGTTNVGEVGIPMMAALATSAVVGDLEGFPVINIEKAANKIYRGAPYLHCNYGYVLSTHKSQGSEWPEVLVVVEDSVRMTNHDSRAWLYTAVTRAQKKSSICFLGNEALAGPLQ